MAYRTGSHTRFYHRFHIVWVTKYRYDVLRGEMRERLREIIRQACAEMGVQFVNAVLSTNHVHMFLSFPPHLSLSTVMQRTEVFSLLGQVGVNLGWAPDATGAIKRHARE